MGGSTIALNLEIWRSRHVWKHERLVRVGEFPGRWRLIEKEFPDYDDVGGWRPEHSSERVQVSGPSGVLVSIRTFRSCPLLTHLACTWMHEVGTVYKLDDTLMPTPTFGRFCKNCGWGKQLSDRPNVAKKQGQDYE